MESDFVSDTINLDIKALAASVPINPSKLGPIIADLLGKYKALKLPYLEKKATIEDKNLSKEITKEMLDTWKQVLSARRKQLKETNGLSEPKLE